MYALEHDWSGSAELSTELVLALQRITGADVTTLDPLSDTVDPDALNQLFTTCAGGQSSAEVVFRYSGSTITVRSNGDVRIVPGPAARNLGSREKDA